MILKVLVLTTVISTCLSQASQVYYSGQNTTYYWTSSNNNSYVCGKALNVNSGIKNANLICAQTEYPKTQGGAAWEFPSLICPTGTVVNCFVYASFGRVGGRCDGGEVESFREDPSGQWTYMPLTLANQVIGQSSFEFKIVNQTINGVDARIPIQNTQESNRLKVVALCQAANSNTNSSSKSSSRMMKAFSVVTVLILYILF